MRPLYFLLLTLILHPASTIFAQIPIPAISPIPRELREQLNNIEWTDETIATFISEMPKFETHLHLDGTLSSETILELAKKQDYTPLKTKTLDEIQSAAVVSQSRGSLAEVLKAFETIYPLLHTAEAMEKIAYDLISKANEQNVLYLEVRFAPSLQAAENFSVQQAVEAVRRGLRQGERDFGVQSGIIISLYRTLPVEQNEEMFQVAKQYYGDGVVGIDLAGDESKFPLSDFKDFYKRAKDAGMFTTVHAGEVPGGQDLELALELGVDRIGHANLLTEKPELYDTILEKGISIEVNLTSNLMVGAIEEYEAHPISDWVGRGIPILISTDDPGVFGIDLAHELGILVEKFGWTPRDIIAVQLWTIDALFLPKSEKEELRIRFKAGIDKLLTSFQ